MLIMPPNSTERLFLHLHSKIIPILFTILSPLVLQILVLPLSLTHSSHVGLERGESRKGKNNLSLNIQTIPMASTWDPGKHLKHQYDSPALAGEKVERENSLV